MNNDELKFDEDFQDWLIDREECIYDYDEKEKENNKE